MPDTYPVVKIPPSISNARRQQSIGAPLVEEPLQIIKYPKLIQQLKQVGYGLLFLSLPLFAIAVTRDPHLLTYSSICFCLGVAGINIASLFKPPQVVDRQQPVETVSIDYATLLSGKVIPYGEKSTAPRGTSERHFEQYLTKYFAGILHPGYEFKLNDDYQYSSDFTLILVNGISLIVEVDEPYNGRDKSPTHCIDVDKDYNRDLFFINGNWVVIRFSEFQVCAYPTECCYFIARTIDELMQPLQGERDLSESLGFQFKGVEKLPMDYRWTYAQANYMTKSDYRLRYLKQYKVYANSSQKKCLSSGVKYFQH
jgi:very-short-patch-repair endonuclease